MMSDYCGTPSAWLDFLAAWLTRKNMVFTLDRSVDIEHSCMQFPFRAPASHVHFCAAMTALHWPGLIKAPGVDDGPDAHTRAIRFFPHAEVDLLMFSLPSYHLALITFENDAAVPQQMAADAYREYSRRQDPAPPLKPYAASYHVGGTANTLLAAHILLNPLVVSEDGEWEAVYMDFHTVRLVRFRSFADLIVWFCLHDIGALDATNQEYADHRDDTEGLSKALFRTSR